MNEIFKNLTLPELLTLAKLEDTNPHCVKPDFTAGKLVGLGLAKNVGDYKKKGFYISITPKGLDWMAQAREDKKYIPCPESEYPCITCNDPIHQGNDCWHITEGPLAGLHHVGCLEPE